MKKHNHTTVVFTAILALLAATVWGLTRLRKEPTPVRGTISENMPTTNIQLPHDFDGNVPEQKLIIPPTQLIQIASEEYQPSTTQPSDDQPVSHQMSIQTILKYGQEDGELGIARFPNRAPVGPESFTRGINGEVLLADLVNQRILVYSDDGKYLRKIDLPGIVLNDIAIDNQGRTYIFDQVQSTIHQLDPQGILINEVRLIQSDTNTRGYFHVVGDSVFFADAAVRDVLVATIEDGVLVAADTGVNRLFDGIHGYSGRLYSLILARGQAMRVHVGTHGQSEEKLDLDVSVPGIVSAVFLGDDQTQRFHVQIERVVDEGIILEVYTFGAGGNLLAVTQIPENDYAFWTSRYMAVRIDGTLVQYIPQSMHAKLNFINPIYFSGQSTSIMEMLP